MDVSATTWRTLSTLLDEALDHAPSERAAWLAHLASTRPELAPLVEKLLSAHGTAETEDLLAHPPELPALHPRAPGDTALAPDQLVGPYRLRRQLGTGGMADVWLAERNDGALTRSVALKLPHFTLLRRDLAQRFTRERDILARLEHPHIARLYDAGVSAEGLPYLAMEYVDGAPITTRCDERALDVAARLRLFEQVLAAVQYAHAHLVIHRDLKPSNILVTADGQAHLLDFGIAKLLAGDATAQETHLTQMSGRAMTPDYASPEQVLGRPLTTATDVYSLGVVLYELLSGKRPYRLKAPSAAQLEEAIIGVDPPAPSTVVDAAAAGARGTTARALARQLASDLDTIVMKALAKLPADRYATIAAFAEDLERYRTGLPVRAQPAALVYRARKFVARNKLAVGAVAGVVCAIAAGAAVATWQARQAQHEAAKADAVKDFLTALFKASSLEPADAARRRSLTAGQLLEEGAARIGTHFQDQPALKAELQGLVGGLLHDLALNDQALTLRRERAAMLERTDAAPLERAAALRDIADTLAQKGDSAGAQRELEAAIALLDARGKGNDPLRWALYSALGYQGVDGDRALAEQRLQQAVDRLGHLAPRSVEYAEALLNLAEVESAANRTERAMPKFDEGLALLERALGPRSMRLAEQRYRVAAALASQRRLDDAERHLRAALATLETVAGKDHPVTAAVQISLGRMLSIQGDPAQARALLASAVAVLAKRNDIDPQSHAEALLYLGESFLDEGRIAPAGPPLEDALRRLETNGNVNTLTTGQTVYARYLLDTGRYAEAEAQLTAARAKRAALLGPDHPSVASLVNRLGLVYLAAGRTADAETAFQSVLGSQANREEVFGSAKHLAEMNLATIDLERERFDAAVAALRRHMAAFEALPPTERGRLTELALDLRLARALLGNGATDEADRLLQRAAQLTPALYEHAPLRITEQLLRARLLAARHDAAGARAALAQARASLRAQAVLGPHFDRQVQAAERDVVAQLKKGRE